MNKQDLRLLYKQKRSLISQTELKEISSQIEKHIFSSFNFTGKHISIFFPIKKQNELITYTIIDILKSQDCSVYVPKVIYDSNSLIHVLLTNESKIFENKWGIPEPLDGETCFPEVFDFVFVPLLVCDQFGNRIGYGKGFYDAFLTKCKKSCKFIGLSHFELEQDRIVDILETDISLHFCITPTKVHSFNH